MIDTFLFHKTHNFESTAGNDKRKVMVFKNQIFKPKIFKLQSFDPIGQRGKTAVWMVTSYCDAQYILDPYGNHSQEEIKPAVAIIVYPISSRLYRHFVAFLTEGPKMRLHVRRKQRVNI